MPGRSFWRPGADRFPNRGVTGLATTIAHRLGHPVTATVPALVPLVLEDTMFHQHLSGLSQEVGLTTVVKSRKVDCRTGSLLWTHFGISGPVRNGREPLLDTRA